jgi:hypothetical protein
MLKCQYIVLGIAVKIANVTLSTARSEGSSWEATDLQTFRERVIFPRRAEPFGTMPVVDMVDSVCKYLQAYKKKGFNKFS